MQDAADEITLRDEEGALRADFLHAVEAALEAGDTKTVRDLTLDLHEADLADLIQLLRPDQREPLIAALGRDFNAAALSELDEGVRDQVLEEMPNEAVAEALQQLDSDEAVYLIEDLDKEDQTDILAKLPSFERAAIERSLEYPEDSAGRIMQTDFIAVPPFWSVGQTIDYMRDAEDLPDRFYEVFVVDPSFHLIGSVALDRLLALQAADQHRGDHRERDSSCRGDLGPGGGGPHLRALQSDLGAGGRSGPEAARRHHRRRRGRGHPGRGIGRHPADGWRLRKSVSDPVWQTAKHRFIWLFVNLGTAILASYVISLFDATIEQMVALAVLMPIVASMGGNAGKQTMTVTVRALATQDLGAVNTSRVIGRETIVGLFNGLVFALIMGLIAFYWFGSGQLGMVIAAAMVDQLLVAALSGILIPLGLHALDLDPAIASGVFVTMMTDCVGFFAFLGLAALWLT